jgi:hypothetical protein
MQPCYRLARLHGNTRRLGCTAPCAAVMLNAPKDTRHAAELAHPAQPLEQHGTAAAWRGKQAGLAASLQISIVSSSRPPLKSMPVGCWIYQAPC